MALPAELRHDKTERLRGPRLELAGEVEAPRPPAPAGWGARARHLARRAAARALGPRGVAFVRSVLGQDEVLRRADESLRRTGELELQVASLQQRALAAELTEAEVHATTVNLELLKGEVRSVVQALEELGMAISPAAGLPAAGARLSELRERVNGLDRRLRSLVSAPPAPPPAAAAGEAGGPAAAPPRSTPDSALFDYVGFERRFRGDSETIAAEQARRYLDLLAANGPVVDVGCGRAELVELLDRRGVEAVGVDTDPSMVAEARDRGLDVRLADGNAFLRGCQPGSLGAIIAVHLVEHLQLDALVELLELAATRLRPGGLFIAETPNPASLVVLGNSYVLDPTHVRPLHPSLLVFLCEGAGFRDVRLRFYAPASDYHLRPVDDPEAPPWVRQVNEAFEKLNSVLFGPQEYAVVATASDAGREGPAR